MNNFAILFKKITKTLLSDKPLRKLLKIVMNREDELEVWLSQMRTLTTRTKIVSSQ